MHMLRIKVMIMGLTRPASYHIQLIFESKTVKPDIMGMLSNMIRNMGFSEPTNQEKKGIQKLSQLLSFFFAIGS